MFSHANNVLKTAFSGEFVPGRVLVLFVICVYMDAYQRLWIVRFLSVVCDFVLCVDECYLFISTVIASKSSILSLHV